MLVRGVAYCHERGIAHRDIHPGNVMLSDKLVPLLSNFEMSFIEGEENDLDYDGERDYIAPEAKLRIVKSNLEAA